MTLDLFSVLEKSNSSEEICEAPELGVKSYAVSMTTLEEVFLKLGEEDSETSDDFGENNQGDEASEDSICSADALEDMDRTNINTLKRNYAANTGRFFIQRQQFKALFKVINFFCTYHNNSIS